MPSSARGRARRELGQNFLADELVVREMVELLDVPGSDRVPVIELAAGDGALTRELVAAGHRVTAVELDPAWVARLRRRCPQARVIRGDMLTFRFPGDPHAIVGNLPFGSTTAMTRRLLAESGWMHCVLLVQWEVARKRAKGGSLLNAQWAPWYEFSLHRRVPARSFRPVPTVDGGIVSIRRRDPLLPVERSRSYQEFVAAVFSGKGRGVAEIVHRLTGRSPGRQWRHALPRDLSAADWAWLYEWSIPRNQGHSGKNRRASR